MRSSYLCRCGILVFLALVWMRGTVAQPPDQTQYQAATQLIEKMRAEKIAAQTLFDNGLLTRQLLIYSLGNGKLLDPGRNLWSETPEAHSWSKLLVENFPEVLEEPGTLNNMARLRVALWFLSRQDVRGATILEDMLAQMPRDRPESEVLDAVIYRLAAHYRSKGENAKALQTTLAVREFKSSPADLANTLLAAARTTYAMGDKEGAMQIYEEVVGYGYGWATGHAYSGMASHYFSEGKLEQGRALLKKPIDGVNADQIRVMLNHSLAQSYYETGEWEEARRYAQATVDQYNSLANPIKNHGLEWIVDSAKNMPRQIDQWKEKPVRFYPEKLNPKIVAANEPIRTYFNIHSYRSITVKAVSTHPDVKVSLFQEPSGYESRTRRMLGVEIAPAAFAQKNFQAQLALSFTEFPDLTVNIPITLQKLTNTNE